MVVGGKKQNQSKKGGVPHTVVVGYKYRKWARKPVGKKKRLPVWTGPRGDFLKGSAIGVGKKMSPGRNRGAGGNSRKRGGCAK